MVTTSHKIKMWFFLLLGIACIVGIFVVRATSFSSDDKLFMMIGLLLSCCASWLLSAIKYDY